MYSVTLLSTFHRKYCLDFLSFDDVLHGRAVAVFQHRVLDSLLPSLHQMFLVLVAIRDDDHSLYIVQLASEQYQNMFWETEGFVEEYYHHNALWKEETQCFIRQETYQTIYKEMGNKIVFEKIPSLKTIFGKEARVLVEGRQLWFCICRLAVVCGRKTFVGKAHKTR